MCVLGYAATEGEVFDSTSVCTDLIFEFIPKKECLLFSDLHANLYF